MREKMIKLFPDINVYDMCDRPVGPHPIPMFEADVSTPEQYWKVRNWIEANHGDLTVLVHPHTGDFLREHLSLLIGLKEAEILSLKKSFNLLTS